VLGSDQIYTLYTFIRKLYPPYLSLSLSHSPLQVLGRKSFPHGEGEK
jgi:hypothetical protein